MFNHEYFEELAALAALGQISEQEFAELRAHLGVCGACRAEQSAFEELLHQELPLADPRLSEASSRFAARFAGLLPLRNGYKGRFIARARQRGVRFSAEVKPEKAIWEKLAPWFRPAPEYNHALAIVCLFLLVAIGFLGYRLRESQAREAARSAEAGAINHRLAELSQQTAAPIQPKNLENEVARVHDDYAAVLVRSQTLETQLREAALEIQALKAEAENEQLADKLRQAEQTISRISAEVEAATNAERQLADKLRQAELALARTTDELQRLRQDDSGAASMIAAQQARIKELTGQLAAQTETLERERSLLVAGRDIRDLMGARNLHIIDVFDVDGRGKTRHAFGRVFYTENKSLIFYAFDLGSRKFSPAKHSFQAWGYREPSAISAQSLGIFYIDDQKQNRWVLKFNDSNVLQQIDALFVTIEPPGGSKKPSQQKLLYAYLNRKPNHP
ncbi:MAG: hypothetical protein ACREA2_24625 [Blastocatellia bacterium]